MSTSIELVAGRGLITDDDTVFQLTFEPGHMLFWGGITTGLCNLIGGASVGVTGSNAAIADAADAQLFIKILIVEIFSSIIPMFGLIVALLMVSRWFTEARSAAYDLVMRKKNDVHADI